MNFVFFRRSFVSIVSVMSFRRIGTVMHGHISSDRRSFLRSVGELGVKVFYFKLKGLFAALTVSLNHIFKLGSFLLVFLTRINIQKVLIRIIGSSFIVIHGRSSFH